MNRMNLTQLVSYLDQVLYLSRSAEYLASCTEQTVIVEGVELIESDFVKSYFDIGQDNGGLWRDITANVTSYIGCEK
jgi:hypothetical protein